MIHRRTLSVWLALTLLAAPLCAPLAAHADEKAKKDKGTFVHIDTLTATLIRGNGRRGVLTVQAGVDVPDQALRARAESLQPRLRDAYVQVLQGYAGELSPDTPPDIDYLGRQMQQATDRVLGRPGGQFLFGGVMAN